MNAPFKIEAAIAPSVGLAHEPIVQFESLTKTFPARRGGAALTALDQVSLTVNRGEIFGVIAAAAPASRR